MDFIVTGLNQGRSQGSSFYIQFDKRISLEDATEIIADMLYGGPNKPEEEEVSRDEHYGYIDLSRGDLVIKDSRDVMGLPRKKGSPHDTYKLIENNMDFEEMQEIYDFLENGFD